MAATNFKTENNTFRKLIGNGLSYRIPRFQRDYSWGEEEWEDLWADLLGTMQPDAASGHYMGYLVLQSADDKQFDVIDGQQRLTTISILVLAVLKNLQRLVDGGVDADANRRRAEQIRSAYIGFLDPVTLVAHPKLVLNRNNNDYYEKFLVPLGHLPQRRIGASEHLLRRAFEWFDGKIQEHARADGNPGRRLAQFVEDASDRLFFTVITVTDELNAYRVFETLNARGVRLSTTDLLKNYLFAVLDRQPQHEVELQSLEERWESMVGRLGAEDFPDFLRVHWNSRRPFARQAELFKAIRKAVVDRQGAFELLRQMEEDLDTYVALTAEEPSDLDADARSHIRTLRMFHVRQPFPLLLAARRRLDGPGFVDLLRVCVVISLRFNVICGFSTGEQERVYNDVALHLATGKMATVAQVLQAMKGIYPGDKTFQAAFAEKSLRTSLSRNQRLARWLLCALEKHLSGLGYEVDSDTFTVEHVLPQHPGAGWEQFSDSDHEAMVHRLGNLTLLRRDENSLTGNASYGEKRPVLRSSSFAITRRLAEENERWDPDSIVRRQGWLAQQAAAVWRIQQLG